MVFPNPTNLTDLNSTLSYIHKVSAIGGAEGTIYLFFPIIILIIFFVVLISVTLSTRRENWIEGLTIASFICMHIYIIFYYLRYIALTTVTLNLVIFTLSFIALIFWNRN